MDSANKVRLLDVLVLGPMQIAVSTYVKQPWLKCFMLVTGMLTIIYNLHNFLYFHTDVLKTPNPIFKGFVDPLNGKIQTHRLYNILIMYPLFLLAYKSTRLPPLLKWILLLDIIIGAIYNSYHYFSIQHMGNGKIN
jgi:hypothetical protein